MVCSESECRNRLHCLEGETGVSALTDPSVLALALGVNYDCLLSFLQLLYMRKRMRLANTSSSQVLNLNLRRRVRVIRLLIPHSLPIIIRVELWIVDLLSHLC